MTLNILRVDLKTDKSIMPNEGIYKFIYKVYYEQGGVIKCLKLWEYGLLTSFSPIDALMSYQFPNEFQ